MKLATILLLVMITTSCGQDETTSKLNQVIGTDERVQIVNTERIPYAMIGQLAFKRSGKNYLCTGTLIGAKHVLTAAHCMINSGIRSTDIYFVPGRNGKKEPYGKYYASSVNIAPEYEKSGSIYYDYAVVTLKETAGKKIGFIPIADFGATKKINTAGYPGDKPARTMWRAYCSVKQSMGRIFTHDCDTFAGQSGSPLYVYNKAANERKIIGVHSGTYNSLNRGLMITNEVLAKIKKWMGE